MISSVGLVDPKELVQKATDKDENDARERVYGMGVSAWRLYRDNARAKQKDLTLRQKLADLVSNIPLFAKTSPLPATMVLAPVYVVAVWDTVGALGIPNVGGTAAEADVYRFADDLLSSNVAHGLHAVSHDERRASFAPTLWQKDARIQQYWFGGAHSDVGGGYPARESGLSNIALKWMVDGGGTGETGSSVQALPARLGFGSVPRSTRTVEQGFLQGRASGRSGLGRLALDRARQLRLPSNLDFSRQTQPGRRHGCGISGWPVGDGVEDDRGAGTGAQPECRASG